MPSTAHHSSSLNTKNSMRIETLLIIIVIALATSCTTKSKSNPPEQEHQPEETNGYRTAQFIVEDSSIFVIPPYINTNINCIKRGTFAHTEKLSPQIATSYFSEYSSIYFFTVITSRQIRFETFNEKGTPKPNLIFYVDEIAEENYQRIFDFFKKEKNYQDLVYTHDSKQHMMIKDKAKNVLGDQWEGDQYPLTKLESTWLVKRHLEYFGKIGNFPIAFKEELLKPVFYNLCNYEKEFQHWKTLYPEIQNHELKY